MTKAERNIELARRGVDAFSRGALEESLAEIHPEVEWHVAFRLPDLPLRKDIYHGREEVKALWNQTRSVWDEFTIDLEDVPYADEERMVARARFRGRGAGSGVEVDRVVFYAFRVRDCRLGYCRAFDDETSARADLGLG